MDLSTDSQVDFIVNVGEHESGESDEMEPAAEQNEPNSDGTTPPPSSAVNLVAEGSAGTEATAAATTAAATMAAAPTSSQPTGTATTYMTMGVAPGDGDLMPPRFSGDRKTDAEEWLQDLLDYMEIRKVPKTTAAVLLRTRLTGVARKWLESVPPETNFDETIERFRKRFGDNGGSRNELLNEFWHRRQGPDEPVGTYIEEMASLARRMKLDNEPLMRQGIIQGLRPEIKRDVMVQKPSSLEALAEAATIGEANARSTATRAKTDDAAVSSQLAEMRAMMMVMQEMMVTAQRPSAGVHTIDAPTLRPEESAAATTPTTTTARYQPGVMTATATPMTVPSEPRHMTIQLVMPETTAMQYGGGRGGPSGRSGRGRGRGGWRGPWRGRPTQQPGVQQPSATAMSFQPSASTPANGNWSPDDAANTPPCHLCARRHPRGDCYAADAICYHCSGRGHYFRCCPIRQNPTPQY